jgi:2-methylisocitrate lyase-like PEP mutase family enzyme
LGKRTSFGPWCRLFESLGAAAMATTSAGTSWSLGYPDANAVPRDALVAAVRAIARVVRVPLSVDVEVGYSDDPGTVGETVAAIVGAGAVGITPQGRHRHP